MATAPVGQDKSLLIEAKERRQATELFEALEGHPERLAVESAERLRGLPPELAGILATVVEVMARGGSVTIGSLPEELTTTVAAEQLGISRPTLMKIIQSGEIPAHRKGSHHRLNLSDVQAFRRARIERQRTAFEELRALEDELDHL